MKKDFIIDPSESGIEDENMELVRYLQHRNMTLDIWDADTFLLFGTCKLPLFELLRQQRSAVIKAKELDIVDADTGKYLGGL